MSLMTVGISDLAVSKAPDVLVTYALGSCVGICLHDKANGIGGLVHIMLPDSKGVSNKDNLLKFADTGIQYLLRELQKKGANMPMLTAKIAGGAQMFANANCFNIGERNVKAVKQILNTYKIKIIAEQTGGNIGRTIFFDIKTGLVEVKSATHGKMVI